MQNLLSRLFILGQPAENAIIKQNRYPQIVYENKIYIKRSDIITFGTFQPFDNNTVLILIKLLFGWFRCVQSNLIEYLYFI